MLKDIIRINGKVKQKEYKTIYELVKKYLDYQEERAEHILCELR